jgi:hypothetical protein
LEFTGEKAASESQRSGLSITVRHAKETARQWVLEEASREPGFAGAFLHGSINWLPDDAALPAASDVDVMVVLANRSAQLRTGKFIYHDVLLEVSSLTNDRLQSPEQLLGDYQLASSFRTPVIIADPAGQLTEIQAVVSRNFSRREWVRRRCEDARNKAQRDLGSVSDARIFADQVLAWLFGAGKTAHILLVAGLMNPTVRRRYVSVRELLRDYGHLDLHESLLETLGCARMSRRQAEQHLASLTAAFDTARTLIRTPFPFASDISAAARPIAIDGSRELIEAGYHREAIFWMAVTSSRCQVILSHDAPAPVRDRFSPGYQHLLNDLGIASSTDLRRRADMTGERLRRIWDVAQAILAANPAVQD